MIIASLWMISVLLFTIHVITSSDREYIAPAITIVIVWLIVGLTPVLMVKLAMVLFN